MNKPPLLEKIRYTLERDYPLIAVQYQSDDQLLISKAAETGFDIIVEVGADENTLVFGEWHNHFSRSEEGEKELLRILALGLSMRGRLSVTYIGTEPVRSAFETIQDDGTWRWYAEMGAVNFNPFAKKTTQYFQNDLIPVKDLRPGHSDHGQ